MTTATNPAVSEYLARTQAALADLPPSEVEEILEDIGPHLAEVAAELGDNVTVETLTQRLGTPEQYASELRAAAGYPPAGPAVRRARPGQATARLALWSLVLTSVIALAMGLAFPTLEVELFGPVLLLNLPLFVALILIFTGQVTLAAVTALPEYRACASALRSAVAGLPANTGTYLSSLRPAWWLIRIVALLAAMLFAFNHHDKAPQLVSAIGALIIVLWVGTKARQDHRLNWLVIPANAFTAGLIFALLFVAGNALADRQNPATGHDPRNQPGVYVDGQYVENIYVFGPDGKPLAAAFLYDQDGRPIVLKPITCHGLYQPSNKFPQPRSEYDAQGRCRDMTGVPFSVAVPTTMTTSPAITPTTPATTTRLTTTTTPPPPATTATPPPTTK